MSSRYVRSEQLLERALRVIPGGTQTFSKSRTQYPLGVSPFFVERGHGSHVWDVDGNEYVDFISGLLAVNLGYGDPDVTAAVTARIADGTIYSLPHEIEIEMSEKVVELVPSAEMVRFGKNGSDATAGAVRLARAYTGRDYVMVCGYHGWQDWYIGSTTRDAGVPAATKALTLSFTYNDLNSLRACFDQHPDGIAAVVMEPTNVTPPADGFLEGVRELCDSYGALLVFDEVITGFRYSIGGAQELYNVMPDITALGKGIANGYPLSAVAGRAEVMKLMEDVFFSFTLGGDVVALAAGLATITKVEQENVPAALARTGGQVIDGVAALIDRHGVGHFVSQAGQPCWSFLNFNEANDYSMWEIKTLWLQECLERGVLCIGTHNMSFAHSEADVARLLDVYDQVFPILKDAVDNRAMNQLLRCEPLVPLFKVR